jgi:hypothetical protein
MGAAGTQTATVAFGGETASNTVVGTTELYNGTAWTSNPTGMNTSRDTPVSAGTQTAALAASGDVVPTSPRYSVATEKFNGTTWTSVNNMSTGRYGAFGAGIQTAAFVTGGYDGNYLTSTELYNGTNWTTSPATLNTARGGGGSAGASNTAGLIFGGYTGTAPTAATESFNGTSWTNVNSMNTSRANLTGFGIQTAAIAAGGDLGPGAGLVNSENWNGTSWTNLPSMAYARYVLGGSGTNTAGLVFGGVRDSASPQYRTNTEEWTGEVATVTARTVTTS